MKLSICCLGLLISTVVLGLNEESAKECKCVVNPPLVKDLDMDWMRSVSVWYVPLSSKLEIYRFAAETKGCSVSEIREDELYYDFCLTSKLETVSISALHGFQRGRGEIKRKQVCPHAFKFLATNLNVGGNVYVSLTDNETYVFFISCWDDGEAGWSILSTTKTLDHKTISHILKYAKSLGFNEKYFTRLSYGNCADRPHGHEHQKNSTDVPKLE